MKLITEKYRSLKPSIDYLADEVVIAQAWKKTHGYIRTFNWYADTLALDVSALGIEENARKWAAQINKRQPLYPLEFVPAAKSETWHIDKKNGWCPKEIGQPRNDNPPIRPLAHITIRDQTWATAAMMCLADAVETAQGDCSHRGGNFFDAQHRRVYSYGNRLVCEWKENHTAWFRWGNSDIFRKFFVDYQNFLKRPIEIGRAVADHESKHVFIVNLDLSKFYDHIDRGILIERLRKISKQFSHPDCPVFWEALQRLTDWKWTDEGKNISEQLGLTLGEGLPQGLVASGFFANAYMIEFDQYVGKSIGKEIDRADNIILHDYCRYVDDLRLVISAETENTKSIREKVNKWITKRLQLSAGPTLTLNLKKTKVTPLPDLDNSGSMFNRIEMVQSDLSGPADRDMLNVAIGTLESFLATENNGEIITSAKKDTKLIQLANYEHDIRADTLKRFAANRLESIMRSKRGITSYNTNAVAQNSPIENESELLAKKTNSCMDERPFLSSSPT